MRKRLITDAEVKVFSEVKKRSYYWYRKAELTANKSKASIPLQSVRLAYRPLCRLVLGDIYTYHDIRTTTVEKQGII